MTVSFDDSTGSSLSASSTKSGIEFWRGKDNGLADVLGLYLAILLDAEYYSIVDFCLTVRGDSVPHDL